MSCAGCQWTGHVSVCNKCKEVYAKDNNSSAVSSPNMEQAVSHESLGKKESKGLDTQCSIHVHNKRTRLADADGISAKAVIDGICHAGILQNDSPEHVKEVSYSQEKSKKEETIITITWEV